MKTLNLTQHVATPDQIAAGVFDLPAEVRKEVLALLTFEEVPNRNEIGRRADRLAEIAIQFVEDGDQIMIGGAGYLMSRLEWAIHNVVACRKWHISTVYAFTKRIGEDQHQPDGSVKKVYVFRHAGFVLA